MCHEQNSSHSANKLLENKCTNPLASHVFLHIDVICLLLRQFPVRVRKNCNRNSLQQRYNVPKDICRYFQCSTGIAVIKREDWIRINQTVWLELSNAYWLTLTWPKYFKLYLQSKVPIVSLLYTTSLYRKAITYGSSYCNY